MEMTMGWWRRPGLWGAGAASVAVVLAMTTGAGASVRAALTEQVGTPRPAVLVAVRAGERPFDPGALVVLDPTTGRVLRTLDQGGAIGDALALTPDSREVYYEKTTGCRSEIWTVPVTGGQPRQVAVGARPALSADGTRLAYATGHSYGVDPDRTCPFLDPRKVNSTYAVVTRMLGIMARRYPPERQYPMGPDAGLGMPVGHLSWNADGTRLAVSVEAPEDNEGWQLRILDPAADQHYVGSAKAGRLVPAAGPGTTATPKDRVFFREGVFLPSGELYVVHRCCSGAERGPTSELLQRVDPADGAVRARIAVGLLDRDHTSLDVDRSGRWLLYLSGNTVMVSKDGARPTELTRGYQAVAW